MDLSNQRQSVIEWNDAQNDVLFMRWSDSQEAIGNASKLIIGAGQACLFVYEGQVREVYEEEGGVDLQATDLPFWRRVLELMHDTQESHQAGIYFFRPEVANRPWRTVAPIRYLDPVYNIALGLQAFGRYSLRIAKPKIFFTDVVAGGSVYGAADMHKLLVSRLAPGIAQYLVKARLSYTDIDARHEEISTEVMHALAPLLNDLGLELSDLHIEGLELDDDTQARIARIAQMDVKTRAVAGIDTGVGFDKNLKAVFEDAQSQSADVEEAIESKLSTLKRLYESGLISEAEYVDKRRALIEQL